MSFLKIIFDEISDLAFQVFEDILFVENHEISSRNIAIAAVNRLRSLVVRGLTMFVTLIDSEFHFNRGWLLEARAWAGFLGSNPHLLSRVLFLRIPIGLLGEDLWGLETLCASRLLLGLLPWVLSGNIMPKRSRKRKPEADEPRKAKRSRKPTKPKKRSRKKPKPKLQGR